MVFFLQWPSLQGKGRNDLLVALFGGLSAFLRGRDLNSLKLKIVALEFGFLAA